MTPVSTMRQVEANIRLLSSCLEDGPARNALFAKALIQRGICFVVTRHRGVDFFAPSRFVGYIGNSPSAHAQNQEKDGRETNRALTKLTLRRPKQSRQLERQYRAFCTSLGVTSRGAGNFGVTRKFWDLRGDSRRA
jgi:hypothetical protein